MLLYSNPKLKFQKHADEFRDALNRVMESQQIILGKEVAKFEVSFAAYLNAKYCVGVNSGTDALVVGLEALGLDKGDEVITTALSAHGTVVAIERAGLTPVIVDVETPTYTIDPKEVAKAIGPKTKAILPVHLHGFAANMDELLKLCKQEDLKLVEDCAQAHGAQYKNQKLGTFGEVATFSFYPTKNLGCMGDGGAVVTSSAEIRDRHITKRNYGIEQGDIKDVGLNTRLDELQAAFLDIMLPYLDGQNAARYKYAQMYHQELAEFNECLPPLVEDAVYHQFAIRIPQKEVFKKLMAEKGIQLGEHYNFSMSQLSAFKDYCRPTPMADQVAQELISLPIQPEVLNEHADFIVDSIKSCLNKL